MATATFEDKTREEIVEALFQVQLQLRISMALKAGEQVPERLTSATEKFKQKVNNTAREDLLLLYSQTCKKLDNMADSEPPPQKKRKEGAELPDFGLVSYLGDIVKASLGPFPHVSHEQVLLDLERVRMSKEDILSTTEEEYQARRDDEEMQYQWRLGDFR